MMECRLPRRLPDPGAPPVITSPGLLRLQAAWDWLRDTDPDAARIATACPDMRAICPIDDHWLYKGVSAHGHGASVVVDDLGRITAIMGLPLHEGGFIRVSHPVPAQIMAQAVMGAA